MSLISGAQVAALQRVSDALLPDTVTVLRRTTVPDGRGGRIDTWGQASTVACRVRVASAMQEQATFERFQTTGAYIVVVPVGTDVTAADRLQVTSLGITLEVREVQGPKSYSVRTNVIATKVAA